MGGGKQVKLKNEFGNGDLGGWRLLKRVLMTVGDIEGFFKFQRFSRLKKLVEGELRRVYWSRKR
jgi:phage FluMu protein gp41